ncbi:hypothetical protein FACS1894116_14310 [Betaproteobacteria bacterium]|nr:hypothetical protein FACS1894116_14310 [Betaproteobacteria bacterium]GHU22771.1 hypothetical protein FACS189488_03970 [Betaproteobacteria bacterium]
MKQKLIGALCALSISLCGMSAQAEQNYQDIWWDPDQSGMGFNIGQQDNRIVIAWYHYDANSRPTFLSFAGTLSGGVATGSLSRSNGDAPGDNYDPAHVQPSVAGTATITFSSDTSATFEYDFEGKNGTIPLQRFTHTPLGLSGDFHVSTVSSWTDCSTAPVPNGSDDDHGLASLSKQNNYHALTVNLSGSGAKCEHSLDLEQAGAIFSGNGTYFCESGESGQTIVKNLQITGAGILSADYVLKPYGGGSCTINEQLAGVRHK